MERRNDGNHFGLGALGVLEFGIRKNKLGTEDNGWSGGEARWSGRVGLVGWGSWS